MKVTTEEDMDDAKAASSTKNKTSDGSRKYLGPHSKKKNFTNKINKNF